MTLEAAAVAYARSEGVDVEAIAADVRDEPSRSTPALLTVDGTSVTCLGTDRPERGLVSGVSVVEADRDVEPTPAGAFAYRVTADGTEVAVVEVTPETARLVLEQAPVIAPSVMISLSTGQPLLFTAARR